MLKDAFLHCDKCGLVAWVGVPSAINRFVGVERAGWLIDDQMGDYCPPCKAVVLA